MTPTCPTCRASLHTVGHYAFDGLLMETLLFCAECGYEDIVSAETVAAIERLLAADDDTPTPEVHPVQAERITPVDGGTS